MRSPGHEAAPLTLFVAFITLSCSANKKAIVPTLLLCCHQDPPHPLIHTQAEQSRLQTRILKGDKINCIKNEEKKQAIAFDVIWLEIFFIFPYHGLQKASPFQKPMDLLETVKTCPSHSIILVSRREAENTRVQTSISNMLVEKLEN